jgi:antitoxin ParD1/3/4
MNAETKDAMTSMNISLPFSMKEFIENEVSREGYGTASEFVRVLLREAKKRRDEEKLEKLLLEALDSPASPMTQQDWQEIRERGLARIRAK